MKKSVSKLKINDFPKVALNVIKSRNDATNNFNVERTSSNSCKPSKTSFLLMNTLESSVLNIDISKFSSFPLTAKD